MKRISYIVNPKGQRTEVIERKESRILRQIDQAIASCEDQASDAEEKAEAIIDSFGAVAGSGDTAKLQDKFNSYCEECEKRALALRYADHLKDLKKKLNVEIEVTEEK